MSERQSQHWRRPSRYACGGCSHEKVGGSEDGKPTQSFSGERQYVCRASSGDEFGEDKLPTLLC